MSEAVARLLDGLNGERVALVSGGRLTTAGELGARAACSAGWLRAQGVTEGQRVLLLVPPGPALVGALLGLCMIGAAPVLAEPTQAPGAFQARVAASGAVAAVVDPRLRWLWRSGPVQGWLRGRGLALPPRPAGLRLLSLPSSPGPRFDGLVQRPPEADGLLMFTSGTTGAPKVVVHTHGNLPYFLDNVAGAVAGRPVSQYLAETPQQIFYALLLGATCHLVRGSGAARVRRTHRALASGQIDTWFGSPWTWAAWQARGQAVPASLSTVLLGSAPVTRGLLREVLAALPAKAEVRCVYGLSEAGPVCLADGREKAELAGEGDFVGRPLPGVRLEITPAVGGEVRVAGPAVAGRIEGGPAPRPWLHTGDLGRQDEHGLWLMGRSKDMIVRRAVNLYPGVLEPLLEGTFREAVLLGLWDEAAQDERVVAVVVGEAEPDWERLLGDGAPDGVARLPALPRAGRQHKVDKLALREALQSGALPVRWR